MSNSAWLARNLGPQPLAPISLDDAEALESVINEREFSAGDAVFCRGSVPDTVFVIRNGTVALSQFMGNRRITLELLGPGSIIGDIPVLLQRPELYDALALSDVSTLEISAEDLVSLLRTRGRIAHRWLVSLADRTTSSRQRVRELLMGDLQSRVASFLLYEGFGSSVEMSQQSLADLLGAKRQSLNAVLRRFEKRGVLRLGYRVIEIVDPGGLRLAAGSAPAGEIPSGGRVLVAS